ncbi:DUF2577 domain-containing protein [Clostridium sp. HBUAS56010]|uniref:DUF2577 domain-containing protein n=1 Tax=Clostridium sp. HBUAS56010 TaxID=2571127 RepID=UPI00117788E1|nr:DUF2577 domain-containing protein [Clostridium sp. HBUAS56010]DAJ03017.1 MAG TPA: Protein of unknown function (DUF2577) [Caudoviricetes sp.]
MADVQWVENIKKIVVQAVEAQDPCDVITGTVLRNNPMEIQIGQKTVLFQSQIIIPKQFTDYTQIMSIPGIGEVSVLIKNGLKTGQKVLLLQKKGGQQFAVIGTW